jgi:hypothetical protein
LVGLFLRLLQRRRLPCAFSRGQDRWRLRLRFSVFGFRDIGYQLRICSDLKPDTRAQNHLNCSRSRRAAFERRATVATHQTENLIRLPFAATLNANQEQPAFFALDYRSL